MAIQQNVASKAADSGVVVGWVGYFLSHIETINAVLQTFALLFAIAASITAIIYHVRKTK
jgi:hypothetical protein